METKKRALGRGLEQLFNNENLDFDSIEKKIYEGVTNEEIVYLNLSDLRPNPYQPRKVFNDEALSELAESIKENNVENVLFVYSQHYSLPLPRESIVISWYNHYV